ncbi:Endoplasmic reticulum membrane protein C2G5.01 [Tolypocladium paradoxum]|uniref:Endoplasmic reticulum membrane protein C2G5.01 n=1 Tax=Tolypocladium paradoxum TaxID=94208 RepID=A0A2S4KVA1_9HYPO|nr:Endoplasmic reticulum membrane protein C2G5.01 [Tolypocladium paradoxum]
MADLLKNVFGGAKPAQPAVKEADSDFADFARAPEPAPGAATLAGTAAGPAATGVPWTKWYNVHERHSLSEFRAEGFILAISAFIFLFHILGARTNRSRARAWIRAHAPLLKSEFALVGFGGAPTMDADVSPDVLLKEKSLFEFSTYASGRQNTAFIDVKITMAKRFNPFMNVIETGLSFFTDMFAAPSDTLEAFLYPFDGKENLLTVPSVPGSAEIRAAKDAKSTYEGFVWAVVNKDCMQKAREDRYDVTLTSTKDHPKLPNWLSVMSENSEITNTLLTTELIAAVVAAGDVFEYLIITDQPAEKPKTLDDTNPRKRLFLKYRLPSDGSYGSLLPLFSYFLRLPDILVQSAQFRPEVMKKVRATREAMVAQMKKALEEQRNEERMYEKEKARKAKRDAELKGLDAKAQKKYLEKEKERELRKSQKKITQRA